MNTPSTQLLSSLTTAGWLHLEAIPYSAFREAIASLGTTLHASARPHTFDARAGAALVLGESVFQIGPELSIAAPLATTSDRARVGHGLGSSACSNRWTGSTFAVTSSSSPRSPS